MSKCTSEISPIILFFYPPEFDMLNVKIVAQIRASLLRSSTKTKMADTLYPFRIWISQSNSWMLFLVPPYNPPPFTDHWSPHGSRTDLRSPSKNSLSFWAGFTLVTDRNFSPHESSWKFGLGCARYFLTPHVLWKRKVVSLPSNRLLKKFFIFTSSARTRR